MGKVGRCSLLIPFRQISIRALLCCSLHCGTVNFTLYNRGTSQQSTFLLCYRLNIVFATDSNSHYECYLHFFLFAFRVLFVLFAVFSPSFLKVCTFNVCHLFLLDALRNYFRFLLVSISVCFCSIQSYSLVISFIYISCVPNT